MPYTASGHVVQYQDSQDVAGCNIFPLKMPEELDTAPIPSHVWGIQETANLFMSAYGVGL